MSITQNIKNVPSVPNRRDGSHILLTVNDFEPRVWVK